MNSHTDTGPHPPPAGGEDLQAFARLLEDGSLGGDSGCGLLGVSRTDAATTYVVGQIKQTPGPRPARRKHVPDAAAVPLASLLPAWRPVIYRYAGSRLADLAAADLLTEHVLATAKRRFPASVHPDKDLATDLIKLAARTANAWEDRARRAHAAAPRLTDAPRTGYLRHAAPAPSTRYPDPAASRAVFVGASRNPTLEDLPQTEASARQLADHVDGTIARSTVLSGEQATRERTLQTVEQAADEATDLLLVYFAGHGTANPDYLTMGTADTFVAFSELYHLAQRTAAAHLVMIVDTCDSGAATGYLHNAAAPPDAARDDYVITSAGQQEAALAHNPARDTARTAFSGALIDTLTRGVADWSEHLDVAALYAALDRAMARDRLPRPHLYAAGSPACPWALAPNPRLRTAGRPHEAPDPVDAALLERADAGDQLAWDELVERYSKLVWSVARSFRLTDRECGEVFRDTWTAMAHALDRVDTAQVAAWLARTARRRAVETLRGRVTRTAATGCPLCQPSPAAAQRRSCSAHIREPAICPSCGHLSIRSASSLKLANRCPVCATQEG